MKQNTPTKSPQPVAESESLVGVASTDLLALSSILGGLLASGHYTEQVERNEYGEYELGLITEDYGKEWREMQVDDPSITSRYVPVALECAMILLRDGKTILEANASVEARHQ